MTDTTFPPSTEFAQNAHVDTAGYDQMYSASVSNPEAFWSEHGQRVDWMKPFTKVKDVSYDSKDLHIRWFEDGAVNVATNCIDRHLDHRAGSCMR